MPPVIASWPHRVTAVMLVALLLLSGCGRYSRAELNTPPDFITAGKIDPQAVALRMRVFHVQQIWAGDGFEINGNDYRAKVTIWAYSQGEQPLAELYFHDPEKFDPAGRHKNSDPHAPNAGTLQIHFPITAFGPIIGLMRSANEPVYLFFYKGHWCIGTSLAEAIGSE